MNLRVRYRCVMSSSSAQLYPSVVITYSVLRSLRPQQLRINSGSSTASGARYFVHQLPV